MQSKSAAKRPTEDEIFKKRMQDAVMNVQTQIDMTNKAMNDILERQESNKVSANIILEQFENQINDLRDTLLDSLEHHKRHTDHLLLDCRKDISKLGTFSLAKDEFSQKFLPTASKVDAIEGDFSRFKFEMHQLLEAIEQKLDKKLSDAIKDISSRPSEFVQVKKSFDERLEVVAMDGSNAILRTTNCEKQLHLIEKKIEQIFLLIKKFDLDGR